MKLLLTPPCDPFAWGEAPVVVIQMWNDRCIRIQLDPTAAPITVAYFLMLVSEGFYNGLRFHRIVPGFMIQGGDPLGTGDGETEFYVKGEFSSNGVDNPLRHVRGAISMARQDELDSASCQFFIMQKDSPSLDGQYAAFGQVIDGIEVVDQIAGMPTDADAKPYTPMIIRRIYIEGFGEPAHR